MAVSKYVVVDDDDDDDAAVVALHSALSSLQQQPLEMALALLVLVLAAS